MQPQSIVKDKVSAVFRLLGMYNFGNAMDGMVMFLLSAKQRKFWKPVIQGNSGLFKRLSASLALSTNVIWVLAFKISSI